MTEDRQNSANDAGTDDAPSRPPPRNPFQEPDPADEERPPALIDTQRSAAVLGVVVGLIALFFVVAICVAASFAFG